MFEKLIKEAATKGVKIPGNVLKRMRRDVSKFMTPNYFDSIGGTLDEIDKILEKYGYMLVDVDGSAFEAMFLGAEGSTTIHIGDFDGNFTQVMLSVSWYKMPSGKWELVIYVT